MDNIEYKLSGLDEPLRKLKHIAMEMRGKPVRSALGKSASPIKRAGKKNSEQIDDPETGRKISVNIVQRFRSKYFRRTGDLMISIGVATERGRIPSGNPDEGARGNTPHWHLVELGTERMAAQPFLRPALENNAEAAISIFQSELSKAIDKAAQ